MNGTISTPKGFEYYCHCGFKTHDLDNYNRHTCIEDHIKFVVIVNGNHTFLVEADNQNNAISKVTDEYNKHRLTIQKIEAYLITQEL